jgi:hypothetical protein
VAEPAALRRSACLAAVAGLGVVLAAGAAAHHGTANYVTCEVITLAGTVTEWRWSNPHTWLFIAVESADGGREHWSIEGGPPRPMQQQGWTPESLTAGEQVTIRMSPHRHEHRSGILRDVVREGGEVLVIDRPWMR